MNKADDILERALFLLDKDGLQLDDCLETFSADEGAKLRPLLETILVVRRQADEVPGPINMAANRSAFIAAINSAQAPPAEPAGFSKRLSAAYHRRLGSRLARSVAAITAALVLTGGVATAAVSSGPTSPLYPIKRAVEAVESALPRSDYAAAKLHLDRARTRLTELEAAGNPESATFKRLTKEFSDELDEAKELGDKLSPVERREIIAEYDRLKQSYEDMRERTSVDENEIKPSTKKETELNVPPANESGDEAIEETEPGSELDRDDGEDARPESNREPSPGRDSHDYKVDEVDEGGSSEPKNRDGGSAEPQEDSHDSNPESNVVEQSKTSDSNEASEAKD